MSDLIDIDFSNIDDLITRKNFITISEFINDQGILRGKFKFFIVTVTGAQTKFKFSHNLGFMPQDVIQTSVIGSGAVTFNYSIFDSTYLYLTTTGTVTVRFFAGVYSS